MNRYIPLLLLLLFVWADAEAQDSQIRLYHESYAAPGEFALATIGVDIEGNLLYPRFAIPTRSAVQITITDTSGDTLCAIDTILYDGTYRAVWDSCKTGGIESGKHNMYFLELSATADREEAPFHYYVKNVFKGGSNDSQ